MLYRKNEGLPADDKQIVMRQVFRISGRVIRAPKMVTLRHKFRLSKS